VRTAARLALFTEAGHDEELQRAPDPERALQMTAACFEGPFLHAIGPYADIDAPRVIHRAVRAAMLGE
jgi:hypothetical protein